jgi:hypothetical protein
VRPEASNGNYFNNAALTSNSVVQIINPTSNTNGILLINASYLEMTTSASSAFFVMKNAMPTSITDGEIILTGGIFFSNGANDWISGNSKKEILIPSGLGLFFTTPNNAIAGRSFRSARYKIL